MIIIADSKGRLTLPRKAKPGDTFSVEEVGEGQFLLSPMRKPTKMRLVREKGFLVASVGQKVTTEQVRALLDEFP